MLITHISNSVLHRWWINTAKHYGSCHKITHMDQEQKYYNFMTIFNYKIFNYKIFNYKIFNKHSLPSPLPSQNGHFSNKVCSHLQHPFSLHFTHSIYPSP